jgi:hypothetical protein
LRGPNISTASQAEQRRAAEGLLTEPDILAEVRATARARGWAGATDPVELSYCALMSRLLERPINLAIVSESGAGKSAALDAAMELHPPEAYVVVKAGSARVLIYSDQDYQHRTVVFSEADSIPDEGPAASAARALAADNRMEYDVVELDPESNTWRTRHIIKPGPTGLITTSVKSLAAQMGTRLLEIAVDDSPQQTRAVLHAHADRVMPQPELPGVDAYWAYARWLAAETTALPGIAIPFAHDLARLVPDKAVRIRRDFRQLLALIEVHALLHAEQRARTPEGWLQADIEHDYAGARRLLEPIFEMIASEGLTVAIRQTIEAVKETDDMLGVSVAELCRRLGLSRTTVNWRVRKALSGGWLVNVAAPGTRALLVARGAPLPSQRTALPTCEELADPKAAARASEAGTQALLAMLAEMDGAQPNGAAAQAHSGV